MPEIPLILTHRGDRVNHVENTITAVEAAIEQGATGIEIDIRQTADGEIVVFHDFSLRRMFNKPGYLGQVTLADLKTYQYVQANRKQSAFIDTLDAFLDKFNNKIPINLDAKTIHFFDFKFADKLIATIQNHNMTDSVWVSCFNPFLLQILKLKNKRIRTGYLFLRTPLIHIGYDLITYSDAWHPHYRIVSSWLVKMAAKYGKKLFVWTVNDTVTLERLRKFPINGIITDNVPLVKSACS